MHLEFLPSHPFIIARTQVSLPNGAFIRALPFAVDETQRFRIDALVLSADILASAYLQMIELELRSKWDKSPSRAGQSSHLNIAMFQHAWSIVDQLYCIRLLIGSLGLQGEDIDTFMSATEKAYILRNRMDHLNQRIPNIVASKDNTRSLLGNLSYFVSGVAAGSPDVDVFAVVQHADPVRPGEQVGSIRVPSEVRMPIGNFVLAAAGEVLDLDVTILTLGPAMTKINASFEKSIRAQAADKAAEQGVPEKALLAHHGAGLKVMMALQIVPAASAPAKRNT